MGGMKDYNFNTSPFASGTMKAVFDNMRAIDVLETLPYVNSMSLVATLQVFDLQTQQSRELISSDFRRQIGCFEKHKRNTSIDLSLNTVATWPCAGAVAIFCFFLIV